MPRNIEETFEDVLSLTNQDLFLNNSSKPKIWESENEFKEFINKMNKKEGLELDEDVMPRAMIDEANLIIHLNPTDEEWYGPIIGYFQPYCVFLERTRMGRELRASGRKNILHDKKCYFLDGIGRFVEEKTIDKLTEKGYKLKAVKDEIAKDLKSTQSYKAVKICENKWKEAYDVQSNLEELSGPGKRKPNYKEIIATIILASSSDLSKNFNKAFLELENMSIADIFVRSGLYQMIVEKEFIAHEKAEAIRKCVSKLKEYIGDERQIRDIKPLLHQTEEQLFQLGKDYSLNPLTALSERASKLYQMIDSHPTKLRIEEISNSKTYVMLIQTFLDDSEMWINRYSRS